jgi:prolyl oligopeptidase
MKRLPMHLPGFSTAMMMTINSLRAALLIAVCLMANPVWSADLEARTNARFAYPATRKAEVVDDYHGTTVADPYRWLEDLDSAETQAWVARQNQVTFGYLNQLPSRAKLRQRLTQLWNYERFGLPVKRAGRYFYTRNDGLQNQSAVYVVDRLDGPPRLLIDPNSLSNDGTVALNNWVPSEDGKLLAYGIASAGSDWQEWRVLDVNTGRQMVDHLKWVKFSSVAWTYDNAGFFYSRYDEPQQGEKYTGQNYFQKLYYHRLGQPQSRDQLIYERKDEKEWGFNGDVSEDGQYLIISIWKGTDPKSQIFYKKLKDASAKVVEVLAGFDAKYEFLGNDGTTFFLLTDKDAPLRRIVAVDVQNPQPEHWREIVPEGNDVIEDASIVGEHFVVQYLRDAASAVTIFDLTGKLTREVELPGLGSTSGFRGRRDDPESFFLFTNYTTPGTIYRYDVSTGKRTVFREPKVDFRPGDFESKQVFYESSDGTKVPMILVYKKGLKLDGNNPTILYGYGGFNIPLTPGFGVTTIAWLEMGGVYAVANLRGGGEYGRDWHEAGRISHKQNVFDDFIAAAEWLIENKYTSPQKLAIRGGSNGGLLVGAAMTQRPELFAAAVPSVGVLDMLRYHKFTIGWAWVPEYGSADDEEQFKTLLAYSPLHQLKPGVKYPATLIVTGDHDDRVVPAHSYKFAAALQALQAPATPALIRIETRSGHGAGTPTTKLIEAAADVLAFLQAELKM